MRTAGILLLCLSFLTGCGQAEKVKTIVLENPVKAQETEDGRTDGYQMKKIYTWEYAAPTPQSVSVLECGEHEMRLARVAEDGTGVQFDRMDYRYGFHEEYGRTDRERLAIYDKAPEEEKRFMKNALSPDGRFLLLLDEERAYPDPKAKMYLNNLETGEEELLLDGDALGRSEEEYFPLTAWSRDGKYLAYCFFPRTMDVYNRDGSVLIYIFSIEKKEVVGQYAYFQGEGADIFWLTETELHLDVADGKVLAVVASNLYKEKNMVSLEICNFEIEGKSGEEQQLSHSLARMEFEGTIYPDAETGGVYVGQDFGRIYRIEAETGNYGEGSLIEQYYGSVEENAEILSENQMVQFIVLDQGDTVISTEKADTGQDICIYQREGENWERKWERRILYHYNAGALDFLQYDETNHRLLAISSSSSLYGINQTAIILEF